MSADRSRAGEMIPVMRPTLSAEEASAAADAVASGWVAQGPRVAEFERGVAERVGAEHGVATSSCTTALHLGLVLLDVGPGDEVIVPSLSFVATANVVRYMGARVVFADVDAGTLNLTRDTIQAVVTDATKAVILVHQCGTPADLASIHELCDGLGIAVLEDAACAIGSSYSDRPIGAHSDLVAFSFHPRKIITTGEGGMLMCSRDDWAARARRLREHGMSVSAAERHASPGPVLEEYTEVGFNYRMTDIQAAVGLVQLARLDEIIVRRRELGERYAKLLSSIPGLEMIGDPIGGTTNYQSFWVTLPDDFPLSRNDVLAAMSAAGISARRGIMAAHLEPAYTEANELSLPVTERITRRSLILPLFHDITHAEQDRVVEALIAAADAAVGN
jgi:perosamine synthetase